MSHDPRCAARPPGKSPHELLPHVFYPSLGHDVGFISFVGRGVDRNFDDPLHKAPTLLTGQAVAIDKRAQMLTADLQ